MRQLKFKNGTAFWKSWEVENIIQIKYYFNVFALKTFSCTENEFYNSVNLPWKKNTCITNSSSDNERRQQSCWVTHNI